MVAEAASETGRSSSRNTGGRTTFVHLMRMSSVLWNMALSGSGASRSGGNPEEEIDTALFKIYQQCEGWSVYGDTPGRVPAMEWRTAGASGNEG